LLAFFVDWYFNPRRGLHGQAGIGPALLSRFQPDNSRFSDHDVAWGGGLMVGIGKEGWIEGRWSIRLLAGLTVALTTEKDDAGLRWLHLTTASPALMFSVTYQ